VPGRSPGVSGGAAATVRSYVVAWVVDVVFDLVDVARWPQARARSTVDLQDQVSPATQCEQRPDLGILCRASSNTLQIHPGEPGGLGPGSRLAREFAAEGGTGGFLRLVCL
jgi:hypothetical protein